MRPGTVEIETARAELEQIRERANALAELLDTKRNYAELDEVTREVVKACDVIVSKAARALGFIRVAAESRVTS